MMALISRAIFRLRKRRIVENALGARCRTGLRALVYYKTDPLFSDALRNSYQHTNNSEIIEIIRVFNQFGFNVDLVDRDATWSEVTPLLTKRYDVYFANAAGNSAPLHTKISREIDAACKIYYAAGPEPEFSNLLVHQRHMEFDARTGRVSIRRRILKEADYQQRLDGMDAIFFVGNQFSESSFRRVCSLPLYRILPASSPSLFLDYSAIVEKSSKSFLYLGGNGLICKGLDLILEAFDGLSTLSLDICAPATESDFWDYYQPLMHRNPQIKFHGFVDVTSSLFKEITSRTAYNVFPSCSEGCATSVVTAMRRGVIPVVTRESGIDLGEFGFEIEDQSVSGIRQFINQLADLPKEQMLQRVIGTYLDSNQYSFDGFRNSFASALLRTLSAKQVI